MIFLLELTLFFGWGCYMTLQSYYSQATENEVTDIIRERYPVFESVPEEQKSYPITDMPYSRVTFVKPQVTDKLNNFLGDMELSKEQDKTIAIDVDIPTSTPNSISMISNNMVKVSDINNFLKSSPEDSVYDKEIMKNLMSSKISSTEYTDKIINTDNNKDSVNDKFLEKLENIAKSIAINDFQWFENNYDFTKDANRLTLNNQKDHPLDTSNEVENLGLDTTTTANLKDSVDFIKFRNSVQDLKQRFSDLIKDAVQDNHDEESSSRDRNDEQINAPFDSDLVICPPYQSYESSDMSPEHSIKDSSTSQAVSIPEFIEQIKNIYNDDGTENKDKHNTDDSNMSMSASSDASVFGSDEYFDGFALLPIARQNSQDYLSSEITGNVKEEEEKHKFMKNIESPFNFGFLQPKIQDSVESSTSNDKFQWFNAPPVFANDLQLGLKDISESSKTQNPSLGDTIKDTNIINAFIPEKDKFHNKCQIEVKDIPFEMHKIFRIKCPGTMFDVQWNLVPPPTLTTDSSNVINFKDIFGLSVDDYNEDYDKDESEQLKDDLISNENFDKEVTSLQHSAPEVTDGITTSMPSLKDAFAFLFEINFFNRTEIDKHDGIHSSDQEKIKEEISSSSTTIPSFTSISDSDTVDFNTEWSQLQEVFDTQQPKQLKVTEDYLDNTYICSIFPQLCSIPPNSDRLHVNLKPLKRNHDNPYKDINDYNYREKRLMI